MNSCLTALDDELLCGQEQNKPFPLKLLLVMLFHHSNSDPKTDGVPLHYGGSSLLPAMGEHAIQTKPSENEALLGEAQDIHLPLYDME